MREVDGNMQTHESLLRLYFDKNSQERLDQKTISIIDDFITYCKAKDIMDDTKIVDTMEIIYNPQNNLLKSELKKLLALSGSSLYRFRVKLICSFRKFMSERICDQD